MPNLSIKAKHADLNESIKDYVGKKLQPLSKFLRDENKLHVEMDIDPKHKSGLKYHVEVTVNPNSEIFAEARGSDFHEAIDLCVPKIREQLKKQKDKKISLRKKLGANRKTSF